MNGGERLHETSRWLILAQAAADQPGPLQDVEEVGMADGVDEGVQTGGSLADNACGIQEGGT